MVRRKFVLNYVVPLFFVGTSILAILLWWGHKLSTPIISMNARALSVEVRNLSPKPEPYLIAVIPYVYTYRGKEYRFDRSFPGVGTSPKELKALSAKFPPGSKLKVYYNKETAQHLGPADGHTPAAADL